jgi:hypothetical protein
MKRVLAILCCLTAHVADGTLKYVPGDCEETGPGPDLQEGPDDQ